MFRAQLRKKMQVLGVRISCHRFVLLLLYCVTVSRTKATHFAQYQHFARVCMDQIYGNHYQLNGQNTSESHGFKTYVQNVHHSHERMYPNDYATYFLVTDAVQIHDHGDAGDDALQR